MFKTHWTKPNLTVLNITITSGGKTEPLGDGDGGLES
jgi:hypothetical protein